MTFHASEADDPSCLEGHPPEPFDPGLRIDDVGELYGLRLVPMHKLLHMRIAGFWTHETIAPFTRDLQAAIAALDCGPGEHLICCDVSDSAIQPQDVVQAFQDMIVHGPNHARKMALFTTRVLSRMQARRIVAVRDQIAVFGTEADALGWLIAKGDETA